MVMDQGGPRKRPRLNNADAGSYVLRDVLSDIPLRGDNASAEVSITCVEHWNSNLYIGTSASEIIHLVGLPSENKSEPPTYILASRLQPSGYEASQTAAVPGVQQILVVPGAMKACVLCNGTVSFYSLPELTPASNRPMEGVQWIGGIDENEGRHSPEGAVVMIANSRRILPVRVGDKLRSVKPTIDFPGCLEASRRGTIACVADDKSYSLLEVEHQQKIPLFPISSVAEIEEPSYNQPSPSRTEQSGHSRSTSLFNLPSSSISREHSPNKANLRPPDPQYRSASPGHNEEGAARSATRPRSSTEGTAHTSPSRRPSQVTEHLKPHVLSPFPEEFMLTTGTTQAEPGVAMFVNLDGDLVPRGTLEFDRYPEALVVNNFSETEEDSGEVNTDKTIVALYHKTEHEQKMRTLEMQSLAESETGNPPEKSWIGLPSHEMVDSRAGLHVGLSLLQYYFSEVASLLQAVRYVPNRQLPNFLEPNPHAESSAATQEQNIALLENHIKSSGSPSSEYEKTRNGEEEKLVQRLCYGKTRAMVWSGDKLWQILRNPRLLQLEQEMLEMNVLNEGRYAFGGLQIAKILSLLGRIRDQDPQNEIEFRTLRYVRQKASVMLFLNLLATLKTASNLEASCNLVETALHEGGLDPRVPLLLLPPLAWEVLESPTGMWLEQGIVECLTSFKHEIRGIDDAPLPFWMMIRHYLSTWQEKRGYASIEDDTFVFDSVDAALLHLLLIMDSHLPSDSGLRKSTSNKLNNVVDNWKGDFERAVALLEHYRHLYVLSRLHQSKKSYRDVLATWKRICEGEYDSSHDITVQGILWQLRKYLPNRTDASLVREYGLWLAKQSPELAVEVFADDNSRIKFPPAEVVSMLKDRAPDAVQLYLEHLVFAKHLDQYADDLVGYYLDTVLNVLEQSDQARQSLADSYSTYRAMTSPKPTYLNFITQNNPGEDWWQSRLRLLQLLGSGGYAAADGTSKALTYSIDMVLDRLKPFSQYLVSESIILDARRGRHEEALKLLVHGLGDFDTAVRYCYFGGPAPSTGTIDASLLPSREFQSSLFQFLFDELLEIEDVEERLERTSHLLGTFATWFDPLKILTSIPEDWSVAVLSEFLLRSFRAATSERNEAVIMKALSAAQYLQKQAEFISACEKIGAKLESESSGGDKGVGDDELTVA